MMAGALSVHAVDVTRGQVAVGLKLELHGGDGAFIASGRISQTGLADCTEAFARPLTPGRHILRFWVADYYRQRGDDVSDVPFLDVARFDFEAGAPDFHIHLPFKFSPWGYSLFRGN